MNVIILNKFKEIVNNITLPIEKTLIGNYSIDDIVNSFSNFSFDKLIIDLSSIKDQNNLVGFQRMASTLNMSNVIFIIDGNNDNDLIAKLIPFGIYNFANSPENIVILMNTPNAYKDVSHYHDLMNVDLNKNVSMNSIGNVRVIGFKNMTKEAGSTSLINMSKMYLEKFYKVLAIEVGKDDFRSFRGKNYLSVLEQDFVNTLNKSIEFDIILVDMNNSAVEVYCSDVLYLIEPSVIKLSLLQRLNPNLSEKLRGKKVVLNKSFLNSDDLYNFEYEGKFKIYFNLPPINDRLNKSEHIKAMYKKLGINKKDAKKVHRKK